MKIPFDIKFRPQIESGEYKVCIDYDWPVEILSWDCIHVNRKGKHFPILAKITCLNPGEESDFIHWYNNEGKYDPWDGISSAIQDNDCIAYCPGHDLFIITPEQELSEFEERIFKLLRQYKECDIPLTPENIKAEASMLWPDFEKYFFDLYGREGEGDSALRSFYYKGLADGKAEALKGIEQDPVSKRAEIAALGTYPKKNALNKKATGHYDANYPRRKAYQHGYEQAEKDTIERAWEWMISAKGKKTFENFRKAMEKE